MNGTPVSFTNGLRDMLRTLWKRSKKTCSLTSADIKPHELLNVLRHMESRERLKRQKKPGSVVVKFSGMQL